LPTFTFRQFGVRLIEFQGLPGQKARALRVKNHRASYFGLRILYFGFLGSSFSIRIPQSAFRI
jgi:hypothetical protein